MSRRTLPSACLIAGSVLLLTACGGGAADGGADAGSAAADTVADATVLPDSACDRLTRVPRDSMETTASGLGILQVAEGEGRAAAPGDTVVAHYLGCLTDGTKFDASFDRNEPISFVLGQGRVIQGWDEGLEGMRPGGVRHLRIPPELGYGARGTPGGPIPPNATLLFQVQMVEVRPAGGDPAGG